MAKEGKSVATLERSFGCGRERYVYGFIVSVALSALTVCSRSIEVRITNSTRSHLGHREKLGAGP